MTEEEFVRIEREFDALSERGDPEYDELVESLESAHKLVNEVRALRAILAQVDREIGALTRLEVVHGLVMPTARGPFLDHDRVQGVLTRARR